MLLEEGQEPEENDEEEGKTFDLAYVKSLRTQAAGYRTKYAAAATELTTLKSQGQTELEQLKAQNETLKSSAAEADTLRKKDTIREVLDDPALEVRYPKAVMRMIDLADIKWDETGAPTNLSRILKSIRTEAPTLFGKKTTANGGEGNGNGSALSMNDIIRRAAGRS